MWVWAKDGGSEVRGWWGQVWWIGQRGGRGGERWHSSGPLDVGSASQGTLGNGPAILGILGFSRETKQIV